MRYFAILTKSFEELVSGDPNVEKITYNDGYILDKEKYEEFINNYQDPEEPGIVMYIEDSKWSGILNDYLYSNCINGLESTFNKYKFSFIAEPDVYLLKMEWVHILYECDKDGNKLDK